MIYQVFDIEYCIDHKINNDRILKTELMINDTDERRATATRFEDMMNKFRNDIKNQNSFTSLN